MSSIHKWTDEEKEFLRECVQNHTWAETAEMFNGKFNCDLRAATIKCAGKRFGIRTGRNGQFRKDHIPANKGKKMSTDIYKKCAPTMFRKGQTPANHRPVGSITLRKNVKRGQEFLYEKTAEPNVWKRKHILEWEKHNGPVPKGKMIIFADGNHLNVNIDNLVMIDRKQNAVMNRWGIRGSDKKSMESAANIALLKLKIADRKRGIKRS